MDVTCFALLLLQGAPQAAADALLKTRAESGYEVSFEAVATLPGARFTRKGAGRRCGPGVLLLEYDEVGGKQVRAVRAGSRSWVYHPFHEQWLAPDEAGEVGVTHGLQNPDDVLRLLGEEAALAVPKGADLEITVAGARAVALAGKLAPNQGIVMANITALLKRDAAGRVGSIEIDAAVVGAAGAGNLKATIDVIRFGRVPVPATLGPAGAAVPLGPRIRAALHAELAREAVRHGLGLAAQPFKP